MATYNNLRDLSFLIYGLGITGQSVVKFFKKNKIKNYFVWDDNNKNLYKKKRTNNLKKTLEKVQYIVLSPGVSLNNSKNKKILSKYKRKIITDIDLIFLLKNFFKSIVITGTNGKSTTCKILFNVLKKNRFRVLLGGNIWTPILDLKIHKKSFLIIEASSFQLAHSKFIRPDFALLLNITNDHIDWHGSMKNYINSKLKIFKLQKNNQFCLINPSLKSLINKKNLFGKLIITNPQKYQKIKTKLKNPYLNLDINDENMSYVYALSKLLNISEKSFLKSLKNFEGLPHRYEVFLKKKNCVFINDSKATTFQASKFALRNTKNVYWIVGGLPKKNDKINFQNLNKNIIKSYIVGKNINFFKSQIQNKINYAVTKNLKNSLTLILKDIKIFKRKNNNILFSPAAASFDQFLNFEKRGDKFKKLSHYYARKYI